MPHKSNLTRRLIDVVIKSMKHNPGNWMRDDTGTYFTYGRGYVSVWIASGFRSYSFDKPEMPMTFWDKVRFSIAYTRWKLQNKPEKPLNDQDIDELSAANHILNCEQTTHGT